MSYSKDEKDWLGRERTGHYDDKGNKIGTSKQEKDWLGRDRTAHFDADGNKTGISKEEKDWLGKEKTVHYDDDGNKTGSSKVEKDWKGDDIIQHYDEKGNKTSQSKYEKDWTGKTILRHTRSSDSGNSAIGILIGIALLIILVLGTFSYPYKLVNSQFAPFSFDWLSDKSVWIFSGFFWILLVSSIMMIRKLFEDKGGEKFNEYLVSNALIATILFFGSLSVVLSFVIKSRFGEDFTLYASIALGILLIVVSLTFWKTTKSLQTILPIMLMAGASIFLLHQNDIFHSLGDNATELIPANNESTIKNNQGTAIVNESVVEIDEALAKEQLMKFNDAASIGNTEGMNEVLAEQLLEYMKLKNVRRSFVIDDKIAYSKRWRLNEMFYLSFTRVNKNRFNYKVAVRLEKTTDTELKRDFIVSGTAGYDINNKINLLKDTETIGLYSSKTIITENINAIAGTSWYVIPNETISYGYLTFKKDGTLEYNLDQSPDYTWKTENENIVIDIAGFTTMTCVLDNGNLLCHCVNKEGKEWDMTAVRKK